MKASGGRTRQNKTVRDEGKTKCFDIAVYAEHILTHSYETPERNCVNPTYFCYQWRSKENDLDSLYFIFSIVLDFIICKSLSVALFKRGISFIIIFQQKDVFIENIYLS